jgi:lipoate-protein ligase A
VIVGRNQNAPAELSPQARRRGVRVFRRTTGGGAVYHDAGNLNWSFIVSGGLQDRDRLLALVLDVLRTLGIAAAEGPRAGIYVNGRKIGGTASATGRGVLLFHGTLLVSTNLDELHHALAAHAPAYPAAGQLQGVRSVPSAVTTLAGLRPGLDVERLETALLDAIAGPGGPRSPEDILALDKLDDLAQDYGRESWILNRQPPARTNNRKARAAAAPRTGRTTP